VKAIPSSKIIDIGEGTGYGAVVTEVTDWLTELPPLEKMRGCRLTLAVEDPGMKRQRKQSALRELKALAAGAAAERKNVWKRKEYLFAFSTNKYTWRGQEIYLTAGEALFLFKWLVLGDKEYYQARRDYLRNMRRRFGKEFLAKAEEEEGGRLFLTARRNGGVSWKR
jgi:hypothetical protein